MMAHETRDGPVDALIKTTSGHAQYAATPERRQDALDELHAITRDPLVLADALSHFLRGKMWFRRHAVDLLVAAGADQVVAVELACERGPLGRDVGPLRPDRFAALRREERQRGEDGEDGAAGSR